MLRDIPMLQMMPPRIPTMCSSGSALAEVRAKGTPVHPRKGFFITMVFQRKLESSRPTEKMKTAV